MTFNYFKSPLFRQIIAVTVSGWLSVATGFSFGFSAVILPQLKKDEDFPYTDDLASWIASITPLSMVIGCITAGSMIDALGRKSGHIVLAAITTISWLVIALSSNVPLLLFGRFIAGLSSGSIRPVSIVYIGEITDPKYRGFCLVIPSLSLNIGAILCHIIGEYFTWKISSYIYAAVSVFCLILLMLLEEAPLWLISQGKTEEGVQAFKWFRGQGSEAEGELNLVLQRQIEKGKKCFMKDILSKGFMKPLLTSTLLAAIVQSTGVNLVSFYAKDILGKTVRSDIDPFVLMIMYDLLRLLAFVILFVCNKFIPRKIFLISVSFCCCVALFSLFILLTYINMSEYVWLSITIIIIYNLSGGCVVGLAWSFVPEIFSGNLRGLGTGIASSVCFMCLFIYVKISPGFIATYGENTMFASCGVVTVVITVTLCFLLPETNGRTLQDIDDSYNKNNKMKGSTLEQK